MALTIDYYVIWTLDAQNGKIAQSYLDNAEIPSTQYNFKDPQLLDGCDDIFAMPHADPEWSTHSNLLNWNNVHKGSIWAACHAVSALEDMFNPAMKAQQTNFLSQKTGVATGTGPWEENALVLWGNHDDGSGGPYSYGFPTHPVMQFLGTLDAATENGSEQIYLPVLGGGWNTGTFVSVWDPNQSDIPTKSLGKAAKVAFGHAFGDPSRGRIMYEAGHSHSKSTAPDNVAAQRAFFNFSFWAAKLQAVSVSSTIPNFMTVSNPVAVSASATGGSGNYVYSWSVSPSGAGTFGNASAASTTFTPSTTGPIVITVEITDACGRSSFDSEPVTVVSGPLPPVATNISENISECGSIVIDVLGNAGVSDPNSDPLTLTLVGSGSNGTFTNNGDGTVTYTHNGLTAPTTDQISYYVCDNTGLCSNTNPANTPPNGNNTISIAIGSNQTPIAQDDGSLGTPLAITQDQPTLISVLADNGNGADSDPDNGTLTVTNPIPGALVAPSNGSVTVVGNKILYTPNPGYTGTDQFEYQICDDGCTPACASATVYVNVACTAPSGQNRISGVVYFDDNGNGSLETGEVGQSGVDVRLYADNSPNDGSPDGPAIQTTTTDANGGYSFDLSLSFGSSGTVDVRTSIDDDDAREKGDDGKVETDKDFKIKDDSGGNDDDKYQAIRFPAVTIPANAVVTSAYIELTAKDDRMDTPVGTTISGQAGPTVGVTPAAQLTPAAFIDGNPDNQISDRLAANGTSATVEWRSSVGSSSPNYLGPWTDLQKYQTPDLTSIVNEIRTEVTGSSTGLFNNGNMVFFFEAITGAVEERKAYDHGAAGGNSALRPRLVINYTIPGSGATYLVDIDAATLPNTSAVQTNPTAGNYQGATFTAIDQADCSNNFGFDLGNNPPVPQPDVATTEQDVSTTIDVLNLGTPDSDPDAGQTITITSITSAPNQGGTATINNNGTPGDPTDDYIDYSPPPGFAGTEVFKYSICDNGTPVLCEDTTVTVTITLPVNDPPVANDDVATTEAGTQVCIDVLINDTEPENEVINPPVSAGESLVSITNNMSDEGGTLSIAANGEICYTPPPSLTGTAPNNTDFFYYELIFRFPIIRKSSK